ncbi:MAG TPA: tetratricopeptide repeat protein, partial [Ktedonobacteraceae bacterium]
MGKTRLAEEAAREAKRRNWAVAWSRAYTQESSVPYRLWTETLRKAMSQGLWQRQEAIKKSPLIYQPLRALLPELADLLPPMSQKMPPPPEQEQLRLWESTRALLGTICENTTLLIVLDDLQWADASSCELLTYLVRQMRGLPVMFLCTCRDTELPSNHPLRGLLTDLQREQAVEQIPVRPLSEEEIGQLIAHLPEPVVKSVSTRASGNPFFAEELARGITTNAIDVTFDPANPNQLPDTIQAVLDLRLARISPECQRLLERGAVLGGAFLFDTIRDMASGGALADEDLILDLLEESLQAGMLTEEGSGTRITYHFWHPLLLTYLYERLSAARRASLHRKAAQVLQILYATNEAEGAAEITTHLVKGGATPALIAHFAELAADRAYSLSAYPDAEKYYRLALEYMGGLTAAASQEERLHHAYILEQLGESMIVLGKFEDARKFYEQVLEIRKKQIFASEEEKQYEAQIQALIWCEISRAWRYLGNSEKARESFNEGEKALNNAGVMAGLAWARIRYQQGHTLWLEGNMAEALAMGNEALERFEASSTQPQRSRATLLTQTQRILNGDPVGLGRVHTLLAGIKATLGQSTGALHHLNQALEVFEKNDIKNEVANVCCNLADLHLRRAEYTLAQPLLVRSRELAEDIGHVPIRSVALGNLGVLAVRLGNLSEAETWYREALALTEQVNDLFYVSLLSTYLATAFIEQGDLEKAEPLLVRALKIGHSRHIAPCIGFALVALGHLRLARALTNNMQNSRVYNLQKNDSKKQFEHLLLRAQYTLHRALTFDGLEADTVLNGQLLLTRIALLLSETENAHKQAEKALEDATTSELVWLQARAQGLLGEILMTSSQPRAAETYFQQALTTFTNTG